MQTPVMDTTLLRAETFSSTVLTTTTTVKADVYATYQTIMNFNLLGSTYTFTIDKWRSRNLNRFIERFHTHTARDDALFGSITVDAEGKCTPLMDVAQKVNAVVQACKDVITCLDKICIKYGRAVLDYAVWYREKHMEEDTYAQFITKLTCHLIVHTDFLAPSILWELVQF